MNDSLENDIRSALARRSAAVSAETVARVAAADYMASPPERSRRLRLRAAIGAGGGATAAGIGAAIVLLSTGAPSAYAGWSPTPTRPTADALASSSATCRHAADAPDVKPVLTDARGRYTALIYQVGDAVYTCISDGQSRDTSSGMDNLGLYAKPGPDQLELPGGGGASAPGFIKVRNSGSVQGLAGQMHLVGRTGRDIATVTFVFAHGATVQATVQNGWYFAWWPIVTVLPSVHGPRPNHHPPRYPTKVIATTKSGETIASPMANQCRLSHARCIFAGFNPDALPPRETPRNSPSPHKNTKS